jgi:hypothetical protein
MDQRVAFMAAWLGHEWTMTELAERLSDQSEDGLQMDRSLPG